MKIAFPTGVGEGTVVDNADPGLHPATIERIDADGTVFVSMAGTISAARIALPLGSTAVSLHPGDAVIVLVDPVSTASPVVVSTVADRAPQALPPRLELAARDRVVLRCGDATLELCEDGRVEIRGVTVLSHAEGVQRIRGAQVRIN